MKILLNRLKKALLFVCVLCVLLFVCLFVCVSFVLFCCSKLFCLVNQNRTKGEGGRRQTSSSLPVISLRAVPRRLFCFDSLVILDVIYGYSRYMYIEI